MRISHSLRIAGLVLIVVGLLPVTASARPGRAEAWIEPELRAELERSGTADLFVVMDAHADLSSAHGMADWSARGAYVYRALQAVAQASQAPVIAYTERQGLESHSFLAANAVYVRGSSLAQAQDLASLPGVASLRLERSYPLPETWPPDPEAIVSWGLIDTRAVDLWALGVRGAGFKVAGIDTGVQWDHPALIGQYGCPDDPGNPACWYDPGNICGGAPCDNNGHGTHTMGVSVAKDDPALLYIAGMAPDATWIACKGCESSACSDFALNACADWVLAPGGNPDNRPHVANNSWGGMGGDDWYRNHVIAWVAAGIFPSFAAGGSGPGCATLGSPCDYPESFCTTAHDQNRYIGSFSARGPSSFGNQLYTKPNISAPGVNIWSTVPTDSWASYNGTSPAAAHSSGAVPLVLDACPQYLGNVYGLFELLQDNADPPPDGNCGAPPGGDGNYTYGYGYLNVLAAVEACVSGTMHVSAIHLGTPPVGGSWNLVWSVVRILDGDGAPVGGAEVNLEWTLPNGSTRVQQSTTRASGLAWFRTLSLQTGTYEACVTGVTKEAYLYAPIENIETCDTVAVP